MPALVPTAPVRRARARAYNGPTMAERASADGPRGEASRMLRRAAGGDPAADELLRERLYEELRAMAGGYMKGERADHTLQPTALVHEAWLKLFDPGELAFRDRRHFLATAARAMRQILVDHARARGRVKRGGGGRRVEGEIDLVAAPGAPEADGVDLVALDGALEALRAHAPRQAEIVELRTFAGLAVEEVARVLEVSERTVVREWRFARAWLSRELERG